MIRLLIIVAIIFPVSLFAGEGQGIEKSKENCTQIQDGSRCYNEKEQANIDEALELGLSCQSELKQTKGALEACRKWRDKYKSLLNKEQIAVIDAAPLEITQVEYKHKWTQNTWLKFGLATLAAFGLGVGVGVAF